MQRFIMVFVAVLLMVGCFTSDALADIEVFLWQHDNRLTQRDPVHNATITATEALARDLNTLNGINYDRSTSLPDIDELNQYDVVMTALSFYCPG